jgi:lipopolysaccharide biosynthesis glycosyltransferase
MGDFECWTNPDGSLTFLPAGSPWASVTADTGATLAYVIHADSWNDAMAQHHERQGWEPYVPMCEDDDGPIASTRDKAGREE